VSLLKGLPEDHPDFDEDAPLPLSARVVGQASFPNVIVTDVRCVGGGLGGSTRHQWLNLGLEGLNHSLAQPLTRTEIKAPRPVEPAVLPRAVRAQPDWLRALHVRDAAHQPGLPHHDF